MPLPKPKKIDWVESASPKEIAIDTEGTGLFIHKGCRAFTVSACSYKNKIYLWHFEVDPFTREVIYNEDTISDIRRTILEHDTVIFHNANYDMQALRELGFPYSWWFNNFDVHDTMVASHAYRSSDKHGLKENALLYLDYPEDDEEELVEAVKKARGIAKKLGWCIADKNDLHESLVGTQKEHFRCDYWIPKQLARHLDYPESHPWHTVCDTYAGNDPERTLALHWFFKEVMMQIPHRSKYQTVENSHLYTETLYDKYNEARRLIYPILDMQSVGIPTKPRAIKESLALYTHRQSETLEHLRQLAGRKDFNPRSPIQLSQVLFQKYKFGAVKHGKSGPSADKDVINTLLQGAVVTNNRIEDKYKFLLSLKEFRKETTTKQYIENYDKHSNKGKIYANFSQTRTGTGRLSCTDPNTTNVGKKDMSNPFADDKNRVRATLFAEILGVDTDHRFSLRNLFGPQQGEQWVCIDYDQFQLRIFAVVSESYDLLEGFERGDDIHALVAKIIFQKEDISDVERTAAKAINFGLLFGAGPDKIELLAGVPGLYKLFMSNFPKAKIYLDKQSQLARTNGYIHTVGGYRLYVPRNAPHAASCYVIQGSEAEIVRNAMCRVHDYRLSLRYPPVYRLLMMIHDELVFTSKRHHFAELSHIMYLMEQAGKDLGIPCKVDCKITTTDWATRSKLEFERIYPNARPIQLSSL